MNERQSDDSRVPSAMSILIKTTTTNDSIKYLSGLYALIPLTKGLVSIVDFDEYDNLTKYKWHAHLSHGRYYAMRTVHSANSTYQVRMHRQIMHTPNGEITHHKNRCTLDNRKVNLRNCTDPIHREIHNLSIICDDFEESPPEIETQSPSKQ